MAPKKAEVTKEVAYQDRACELVRTSEFDLLKAYLNEHREKKILNKLDSKTGKNVLHTASELGNIEIINLLVKEFKSNVNFKNKVGNTPIFEACITGEYEAVELLLSLGAKLDVVGENEDNLLHATCRRGWPGHLKILKLLLGKEIDKEAPNKHKETPLATAFKFSLFESIELLISAGCNMNFRSANDNTQGTRCAFDGRIPLLRVFVNHGGDLTLRNLNDETPLLVACKASRLDVIHYLLTETSVSVNEIDQNKRTALHFACMIGKKDVFDALVDKYKADIHLTDIWGYSALFFAARLQKGNIGLEMVKILLERGIEVNLVDKNYNTALFYACLKGNFKVAKYLLENGADEYLSNCDNVKPFDMITDPQIKKEMLEFVKYLRVVQKVMAKESDINIEKPLWINQLNQGLGHIPVYRLVQTADYTWENPDGEDVLKEPLPAYLFQDASVETKAADDAPIIETQEVIVENEVAVEYEVDDVALVVSEIIASIEANALINENVLVDEADEANATNDAQEDDVDIDSGVDSRTSKK